MSRKATLVAIAVLAGVTALAPLASAQTQRTPEKPILSPSPGFNRFPAEATAVGIRGGVSRQVKYGFGPLDEQTRSTQREVARVLPRFQQVVNAELDNPEQARFRDLRLGLYQSALVICGEVETPSTTGATETRRFIARSSVVTLETAENRQAFEKGLRRTGCDI